VFLRSDSTLRCAEGLPGSLKQKRQINPLKKPNSTK